MFKLVLEKAEEPEIKLPTSAGSSEKQESSRKISISEHSRKYYYSLFKLEVSSKISVVDRVDFCSVLNMLVFFLILKYL